MKRRVFVSLLLLAVLCSLPNALAEPVIPPDEFPVFNSEWNLNNCGHFFTDGEYFFVNGGDGKFYRLDDQLQLGQEVFDSDVRGADRMSYLEAEHRLYFVADRVGENKDGGLYRVQFRDGVIIGDVECLVKGTVANYAIDEKYICYCKDGYNGIYRIEHDGSNKFKLSKHEIQTKNPAVRMHLENGVLYYINNKDHCLWSVPVEAEDENQATMFIERPMHYFIMAPYKREGSQETEKIIIYVEYAENTTELDKAHLAVVDWNGERVKELDYLRDVQSRYINYYHGVLYYIDSSLDPQVPKWIQLDAEGESRGTINITGQGDLKAFKASDGLHWEFNSRVGYIHVFDGWIAMNELGDTFRFYNPRTGRSDVTGGSGSDIWFVNTQTMTSYRCKLKQ